MSTDRRVYPDLDMGPFDRLICVCHEIQEPTLRQWAIGIWARRGEVLTICLIADYGSIDQKIDPLRSSIGAYRAMIAEWGPRLSRLRDKDEHVRIKAVLPLLKSYFTALRELTYAKPVKPMVKRHAA